MKTIVFVLGRQRIAPSELSRGQTDMPARRRRAHQQGQKTWARRRSAQRLAAKYGWGR